MTVVDSSTDRCELHAGTYSLGRRGATALPLATLAHAPEVATIVIPQSGPPTIQRLTASVVVRLDQTPIGIAPKALLDGVEIEFDGHRLLFNGDDAGHAAMTVVSAGDGSDDDRMTAEHPVLPEEPATHIGKARIVDMRTGQAIDLGDSRVVVGRDDGCDLVLSGMDVSRRHCSITPVQGGYLLRDESANGTLINGSRVSGTYLLDHGDIMRVAEHELRFEVEGGIERTSSSTAAPTAILDVSRLRGEHADAAASERRDAPIIANLEIVRGPYSGASFSIDRPVCSIGRAAESDVRIRDDSVSSNHATLLRKGSAWFVVDLRSANGTFVDGLRIAGERELTSGSRLKLGRVELMFRAIDTNGEIATAKRRRSWIRKLLDVLSGADAERE